MKVCKTVKEPKPQIKQPLNSATVRKNNCGHANLGQVYDFVGNSVDMSAYGDEQWQSKSI